MRCLSSYFTYFECLISYGATILQAKKKLALFLKKEINKPVLTQLTQSHKCWLQNMTWYLLRTKNKPHIDSKLRNMVAAMQKLIHRVGNTLIFWLENWKKYIYQNLVFLLLINMPIKKLTLFTADLILLRARHLGPHLPFSVSLVF